MCDHSRSTVDKNISAKMRPLTLKVLEQTVMNEIMEQCFSSTEALGGSGRGTQETAASIKLNNQFCVLHAAC